MRVAEWREDTAAAAAFWGVRVILEAVDSRAQMPETLDELSAPLGLNTAARKRRARLPFTAMQALALVLGLSLVAFVGVAGFNRHFLQSEPVTSTIPESKPAGELSATSTASSKDETGAAPRQAAPGQHKTVTIIDGSSGARHEVVIGTGDHMDGGSRISPRSR
jgi:uncharacterized protein